MSKPGCRSDVLSNRSAAQLKRIPGSVRKLEGYSSRTSSSNEEDDDVFDEPLGNEGFRLIDISILASIMKTLLCPACNKGHIKLSKDSSQKRYLQTLSTFSVIRINVHFQKAFIHQRNVKEQKYMK